MFTDPMWYFGIVVGIAIGAAFPFFFRKIWKKTKTEVKELVD